MIKENKNFRLEQEAFSVRCCYEKELHSNKNGLSTLGFMVVLAVLALASQEKHLQPVTKGTEMGQKAPVPVCSQKVDALCLKENEKFVHSR